MLVYSILRCWNSICLDRAAGKLTSLMRRRILSICGVLFNKEGHDLVRRFGRVGISTMKWFSRIVKSLSILAGVVSASLTTGFIFLAVNGSEVLADLINIEGTVISGARSPLALPIENAEGFCFRLNRCTWRKYQVRIQLLIDGWRQLLLLRKVCSSAFH